MKLKQDLSNVIWAVEGPDAGIEVHDIKHFTDKDSPLHNTRYIFLEKGNDCACLQHILAEHGDDFKDVEGMENK